MTVLRQVPKLLAALGIALALAGCGVNTIPTKDQAVKAYLTAHPDTNGILTLGPNSAEPTIKLLRDTGETSKYNFITFDLSADISQGIKDGIVESAIDQQPYLQGYLPVIFLTEYKRYGVLPANNVNTGPGFVTKDNIEMVEKLAGEYR